MAFTFPQDSSQKAGAVHSTANGNDFYVPQREMGSESIAAATLLTVPTAGTAVQFPATPCRRLLIIALRSNAGSIYVGNSAVSSTTYGAELQAKDSLELNISDASLLWINSSNSGEGVSYIAI